MKLRLNSSWLCGNFSPPCACVCVCVCLLHLISFFTILLIICTLTVAFVCVDPLRSHCHGFLHTASSPQPLLKGTVRQNTFQGNRHHSLFWTSQLMWCALQVINTKLMVVMYCEICSAQWNLSLAIFLILSVCRWIARNF